MSEINLPATCEQFEAAVSDYIDDAMSPGERRVMEVHAAECVGCGALLADLQGIVRDARMLPPFSPSHDLWQGIAGRLDTPVMAMETRVSAPVTHAPAFSFRMLAAAAVLLVAASSGVTWILARGNAPIVSLPAVSALPQQSPVVHRDTVVLAAPAPRTVRAPGAVTSVEPRGRGRYASVGSEGVEFVYEREINAMRRIVDERLTDLDSATVVEIERNLHIIDKAISDSRRALESDPRSRFLATQLDRALENKLDVLRRIALL